jgi:hypothetical protein
VYSDSALDIPRLNNKTYLVTKLYQ